MSGTCALAPNIAIAWTDAPIEIVNLKRGEHKGDDYLKINPRGQVPALAFDNGDVLTEATAILDYIGAAFGNSSVFDRREPLGRKEAEALSYLSSEVHAAYKGHFAPQVFTDDEANRDTVKRKTYGRLHTHFQRLDSWITETDGPWLLDQRSFADAYLYIVMRWIAGTPLKLTDYPSLETHQREMEKDPGVQLALKRQGMKPVT